MFLQSIAHDTQCWKTHYLFDGSKSSSLVGTRTGIDGVHAVALPYSAITPCRSPSSSSSSGSSSGSSSSSGSDSDGGSASPARRKKKKGKKAEGSKKPAAEKEQAKEPAADKKPAAEKAGSAEKHTKAEEAADKPKKVEEDGNKCHPPCFAMASALVLCNEQRGCIVLQSMESHTCLRLVHCTDNSVRRRARARSLSLSLSLSLSFAHAAHWHLSFAGLDAYAQVPKTRPPRMHLQTKKRKRLGAPHLLLRAHHPHLSVAPQSGGGLPNDVRRHRHLIHAAWARTFIDFSMYLFAVWVASRAPRVCVRARVCAKAGAHSGALAVK